jgi:hypothetical protein
MMIMTMWTGLFGISGRNLMLTSLSNTQFPDGGNMQQLGSLAHKYALASRNFLTWGKPVAARVWISVAFLFR